MERNIVLLLLLASISSAEDKWVWGNSRRSDDHERNSRYEVIEDSSGFGSFQHDRPGGFHQRPQFQEDRPPFINRPSDFEPLGGIRPGTRPGIRPGVRPGADSGILTGPVPSWVREPPFKNYDRCKCAAKFNCQSPGISYGQCDVGKQYCCFHSQGSPLPNRPVHSPENGVLVGPGGPVDYPGGSRPFRPPPGGSLGGFGRPPGFQRPLGGSFGPNTHHPELGVLVGPGGHHGGLGNYHRPGIGIRPRSGKGEEE